MCHLPPHPRGRGGGGGRRKTKLCHGILSGHCEGTEHCVPVRNFADERCGVGRGVEGERGETGTQIPSSYLAELRIVLSAPQRASAVEPSTLDSRGWESTGGVEWSGVHRGCPYVINPEGPHARSPQKDASQKAFTLAIDRAPSTGTLLRSTRDWETTGKGSTVLQKRPLLGEQNKIPLA
eukprot:gene17095-biopygen17310